MSNCPFWTDKSYNMDSTCTLPAVTVPFMYTPLVIGFNSNNLSVGDDGRVYYSANQFTGSLYVHYGYITTSNGNNKLCSTLTTSTFGLARNYHLNNKTLHIPITETQYSGNYDDGACNLNLTAQSIEAIAISLSAVSGANNPDYLNTYNDIRSVGNLNASKTLVCVPMYMKSSVQYQWYLTVITTTDGVNYVKTDEQFWGNPSNCACLPNESVTYNNFLAVSQLDDYETKYWVSDSNAANWISKTKPTTDTTANMSNLEAVGFYKDKVVWEYQESIGFDQKWSVFTNNGTTFSHRFNHPHFPLAWGDTPSLDYRILFQSIYFTKDGVLYSIIRNNDHRDYPVLARSPDYGVSWQMVANLNLFEDGYTNCYIGNVKGFEIVNGLAYILTNTTLTGNGYSYTSVSMYYFVKVT